GHFPWWSPNFLLGFPLAYQMTSLLSNILLGIFSLVFGYLAGPKIIALICFGSAVTGMGALMLQMTKDRFVALTAAILTLGAPAWLNRLVGVEHFVVVAALAVLPWCFFGFYHFFKYPSVGSALLAGILYSLLFLTYAKTAVLATPLLLFFCAYCYLKQASFLRPKLPLLSLVFISILLLALLPNLPSARESSFMAGFLFGPFEGWQHAFASKTALSWIDFDRIFTQNTEGGFSAVTANAGTFLGLPIVLIGAVFFLFYRDRFEQHPFAGHFKLFITLGLVAFWLSFGPESILGGQLSYLKLANAAPHYAPALSWAALAFQAWLIFFLLPNSLPGKGLVGIIFCSIYFIVPGFRLLDWVPPYDNIRAPFDFFQVVGHVFTIASAALMLRMIFTPADENKKSESRRLVFHLALLFILIIALGIDIKTYARPLWKSPLSEGVYDDFVEACDFLKKEAPQGYVYPVSGRYFYQMLPALSGVPLAQEAFNNYLQPKRTAALQAISTLSDEHLQAYLNVVGISTILIDKTDVDTPKNYIEKLQKYFPEIYQNEKFLILTNPGFIGDAYIANETVEANLSDLNIMADGLLSSLDKQLFLNRKDSSDQAITSLKDMAKDEEISPNANFTSVAVKEKGYGRMTFDTIPSAGYLVATTSWHPDWTARIDGKNAPIYRALNALPAVNVQTGDEVIFEFKPPTWYSLCLWGAFGAWVIFPLMVCMPVSWRKGRNEMFEEMSPRAFSIQHPLVVIPTYNEVDCIIDIINLTLSCDKRIEILVVDDASPDGTAEKIKSLETFGSRVHLLERSGKNGLGTAYREGFAWGLQNGYDVLLEMDADLSHDPADIPALLAAVEAGSDVAIGSRYKDGVRVKNWPEHRLWLSYWASVYVRFCTGLPLSDATSGFKALRSDVVRELSWELFTAEGYGFQIELHYFLWRDGRKLSEVPILFTERRAGQTKMTSSIAKEAALRVFKLGFCSQKTKRLSATSIR
ncbi:MAG: glycosyltransferase, partial [Chthoniobacterales bacterium]